MLPRNVGFAVVAWCVMVGAVGCGGSDGDVAAPSRTLSASPTATPTPTAEIPDVPVPRRPPDKHTSDGAIAFTKYAIEVINRAYLTGDTRSMMALATPECGTCQNAGGVIDGVYAKGHRLEGGQISLVSLSGVAWGEDVIPTAFTVVDVSEMVERAADDSPVERTPANDDVELLWDLKWQDSWYLDELRRPGT